MCGNFRLAAKGHDSDLLIGFAGRYREIWRHLLSKPHSDFTSVFDAFQATALAYPDKVFLCLPARHERDYYPAGAEFDYRTAFDAVSGLRRLYQRSGVGFGHRVAMLLGNRPEYIFHLLALNALGASVVPLTPDGTQDEMLYLMSHSEADLGIAAAARVDDLSAVARRRDTAIPVYSADALPDALATPAAPPRVRAAGAPGRPKRPCSTHRGRQAVPKVASHPTNTS